MLRVTPEFMQAPCSRLAAYGYKLQALVQAYPWFGVGHQLLFKSLCGLGGEAYMSYLERAALFAGSRAALFSILEAARGEDAFAEEAPREAAFPDHASPYVACVEEESPSVNRESQIFVAGGDYFGKQDYTQVRLDETQPIDQFIARAPHLSLAPASEEALPEGIPSVVLSDEEPFVTETLAGIYAEQGYYKLAISCYEKLCLLYPKKNTYFAALIENLKQQKVNH